MVSRVLRITSFIFGAALVTIGIYVIFAYAHSPASPFNTGLEVFGIFLFLLGIALIMASYLYSEANTEKGDVHTRPPLKSGRVRFCFFSNLVSRVCH